MTTKPSVTWKLLPKQDDFFRSTARESLYSGAFGAGKTRAVCMKLVARALIPGAVEGLCRKSLVSLKATTLKTLLEPEGDLPAVLPSGTYDHQMSARRIRILGGGEIMYFGFGEGDDDVRKRIGSLTLSGCAIDQAEELSESEWTMLRGRVRLKAGDLPRQLYAACNPGPPTHHLARRFGLDGESRPRANCEAITTCSRDNSYLPADYLADLDTYTGLARARYVEGRWVGSEGLVYDRWDRQVHIAHRGGPWARVLIGQDEGYTNPAAMLVVCQDAAGCLHVADEWYERRKLESDVVAQAKRWRDQYAPDAFVLDPSAAALREAMRVAGLHVLEANNDVFGGIQATQKRLAVGPDGPLLTVAPHCSHLMREFESYEWMPDKDKPRKANDHALDALRYAVMHLEGASSSVALQVFSFDLYPSSKSHLMEHGWRGGSIRHRVLDQMDAEESMESPL